MNPGPFGSRTFAEELRDLKRYLHDGNAVEPLCPERRAFLQIMRDGHARQAARFAAANDNAALCEVR